ncbi:MAG TPA: hypothetical protein VNO84_11675 [Burkholderiaceae bacterium]|nr:hypothetical protein [Burkholderiaceae bacterium]
MIDPLTILAALGPLAVDAGKALIARFIAPDTFKPATVAEWLQMRASDVELFRVMNEAGGSNPSYPWVEAVVRLQRPAVVVCTMGLWAYCRVANIDAPTVDNFAAAVGFYLFGDRTLFYSKRAVQAATVKP